MKQELLPLPSLRLPSNKALRDLMGPIKPLGHPQHPVPCGGCGGVWRWRDAETLIQAGTCPGWSLLGCFLEVGRFLLRGLRFQSVFPSLVGIKKVSSVLCCVFFFLKSVEKSTELSDY